MVSASLLIGIAILVACTAELAAASAIRGVAPEDLKKYAPVAGENGVQLFICLRRKNSTTPKQRVPFDSVNDNFCDCHDGSDEPGTEACGGKSQTMFYCPNERSVPSYVYTSRVNDGVCDCCDGNDEWRAVSQCPNTCVEEGRILQQRHDQQVAEFQGGLQQRRAFVQQAQEEMRKTQRDLEHLRSTIRYLESSEAGVFSAIDPRASQGQAIACMLLAFVMFLIPICTFVARSVKSNRASYLTKDMQRRDPTQVLRRVEPLIQVQIGAFNRCGGHSLGLGVEDCDIGGLLVTSIDSEGFISSWNAKQSREVLQVRLGDRLIEAAYVTPEGEERIAQTTTDILRLLRTPVLNGFELTFSATRGEAEVSVCSGMIDLEKTALGDDIEVSQIENGLGGSEIVRVGTRVAEWNQKQIDMGACLTQQIEVGDRLISLTSADYQLLAKMRFPCDVKVENFEVTLIRRDVEDRLGVVVRQSIAFPKQMQILDIRPSGMLALYNEHEGNRQVLTGDRIVSANGVDGYDDMFQQFRKDEVVLSIERFVGTKSDRVCSVSKASSRGVMKKPADEKCTNVAPDPNSAVPVQSTSRRSAAARISFLAVAALFVVYIFVSFGVRNTVPKAQNGRVHGHKSSDSSSNQDAGVSAGASSEDGPVVSEYAKWMEGASEVVKGEKAEEQVDAPIDSQLDGFNKGLLMSFDFVDVILERTGFAWDVSCEWVSDVWSAAQGNVVSSSRRLERKLSANRARVLEMEKKMKKSDNGEDDLAFSALEGRCVSKHISEYKYEVCFYKNAKQGSTDIGKWKRWESSHVALFDGGSMCPGGPARSLRVKFQCGAKEELIDVDEPSRCTYSATMKHPAVCSDHGLKQLTSGRGPRRPQNEEL